jgi:ABC-type transport system involved in multi-copper enzyme maturation permease subunit
MFKFDFQKKQQLKAVIDITTKELFREKLLYSALFFGVLAVGLAVLISNLSFIDNQRIALDFGLTSISLIGGLLCIVVGGALIAREVRSKVHILILAKPINRSLYLIGKYIGFIKVLAVNTLIMLIVLYLILFFQGKSFDFQIIFAYMGMILEFMILTAIAVLFSSFSSAMLSSFMTAGVWIIGHAMSDIKILSNKIEPYFLRPVLKGVSVMLPDFNFFDYKPLVSHGVPIPFSDVFLAFLYAVLYVVFCLLISILIFIRREL